MGGMNGYGLFLMWYCVSMAAVAVWIWFLNEKSNDAFRLLDEQRESLKNAHERIRDLEDELFGHAKVITLIIEHLKLENEERNRLGL